MNTLRTYLASMAFVAIAFWGCSDGADDGLSSLGSDSGCIEGPAAKIRDGENGNEGGGEHGGRGGREGGGEHSGGGEGPGGEGSAGSGGAGEGEESNAQFSRTDIFDQVRAGARLIISYDAGAGAFRGTVENTTRGTLSRVRVEVHLSNGVELGPTSPRDLAAGEIIDVVLPVPQNARNFTTFGAHPEVGAQGQDAATAIGGNEAYEVICP